MKFKPKQLHKESKESERRLETSHQGYPKTLTSTNYNIKNFESIVPYSDHTIFYLGILSLLYFLLHFQEQQLHKNDKNGQHFCQPSYISFTSNYCTLNQPKTFKRIHNRLFLLFWALWLFCCDIT